MNFVNKMTKTVRVISLTERREILVEANKYGLAKQLEEIASNAGNEPLTQMREDITRFLNGFGVRMTDAADSVLNEVLVKLVLRAAVLTTPDQTKYSPDYIDFDLACVMIFGRRLNLINVTAEETKWIVGVFAATLLNDLMDASNEPEWNEMIKTNLGDSREARLETITNAINLGKIKL